jgi:hypothetical protein
MELGLTNNQEDPAGGLSKAAVTAENVDKRDRFPALWILCTLWILWTVPRTDVEAIVIPDTRKTKATFLALSAIAFLIFALRGMPSFQTWSTAAMLGILLAAAVNNISKPLGVQLNQNVYISGYATTALTMLLTLVIELIFGGDSSFLNLVHDVDSWFAFSSYLKDAGIVIVPIVMASIITLVLWLLKAKLIDRHRVNINGLIYAVIVTSLGSLVVIVVSMLSDPLLRWLFRKIGLLCP